MGKTVEELLKGSPDFENFLIIKSYQTKIINKYTKGKMSVEQASVYVEKIKEWTRVLDRRYNK